MIGWIMFGRKDAEPSGSDTVQTSPHERRITVDPGSAKSVTRPSSPPVENTVPRAVSPPEKMDNVVLPRSILKYLRADAINTELMVIKPAMIAALGLDAAQEASLNAALKSMARKTADFQMAHAQLREDKNGGQYYRIEVAPAERTALFSELESMVGAALPGAEPAIANAAWSLLAQSSLLEDLSYGIQELAVVDSKAFGPYDNQPAVELKQFDDSGTMIRRHALRATPELIEHRFPFLKQGDSSK